MAGSRLGWVVAVLLSFLLAVGSLPESRVDAAGTTPTTQITLSGNLDSTALDGDLVPATVTLYDSTGASHSVDFSFVKNGSSWDWEADSSDATITTQSPLTSGTATFGTNGAIQGQAPQGFLTLAYTDGTNSLNLPISMAAVTDNATTSSLTAGANGGPTPTGGGTGGAPAGAGCTPPSPTNPVKRVTIFGKRYTPAVIRVPVGTRICFRNGDRLDHTVTGNTFRNKTGGLFDISPTAGTPNQPLPPPPNNSYLINSKVLVARPDGAYLGGPRPAEDPNSFFEFLPPAEGSYAFHCSIHKGMGGLIVVGKTDQQGGDSLPTPTVPPQPVPTKVPAVKPSIVTIFGNRFRPEKLEITVGTTVKFSNGDRKKLDGTSHHVVGTSYRDPSGLLYDWTPAAYRDPNSPLPAATVAVLDQTFVGKPPPSTPGSTVPNEDGTPYTFTQPGTYNYRGELPTMRGTIVVKPKS